MTQTRKPAIANHCAVRDTGKVSQKPGASGPFPGSCGRVRVSVDFPGTVRNEVPAQES